ncbi:MASE1 domain-containing protein [Phenylobacterium sp.]|uniref:MASE1 domain-containing protein n=1 Tax=Phenylobacterium sp. TaxID=1871053 RepID=UPI0035AF9AD6
MPVRQAGFFLLALAGVYGLAWFCIEIPERSGLVAPIWLANGFLLALSLRAPPSGWPMLMLAGFAGNLLAYPGFLDALDSAVHFAASDVAEVLIALLLIRVLIGAAPDFSSRRDLILFIVVCGLIAPGAGTLVASGHLTGEPFDRPAGQMIRWMVSNAMGLLVATPLLLALADMREDLLERRPEPGALLCLGGLGVVLVVALSSSAVAALFLIAPVLMWVVFRLERVGAALGGAMVGLSTIGATLWGRGPIAAQGAGADAMLLLHGFLTSLMLTSLVVGAVLRERRVLREQLAIASIAAVAAQERALMEESKARQAAEVAAEMKATFLAEMTHELRTPVTSMIGFARIAQDEAPASLASKIEKIVGAGEGLLQTVNDLLDFSKLEAGRLVIRPQPTGLRALGRKALELLEPQADAKGLKLVHEDGPDWTLMVDGPRLNQILVNYLSNAVKFSPTGEVRLRTPYDADRGILRLEVTDNGPGVAPEQASLVFDRYAQTEAGAAAPGTGLGLSICRQLAEAMNGSVGVDSAPGGGSTFWLEIPAQSTRPLAAEPSPPQRAIGQQFEGRVLVADDNPGNRHIARHFLEAIGFDVVEATNGAEAVEQARAATFDIVLMDLNMPVLGGRQAAAILRESDGPNRSVPIIAFSAGSAEDGEGLDERLFNGFVQKPLQPRELIEALAASASRANSRESDFIVQPAAVS